jgi:multiple sugar transport system permease protein
MSAPAATGVGVVSDPAGRSAEPSAAGPPGRGPGWAPWAFLAPYLVLFVGFVIAPAVYGVWISLHDYDYTLPGKPWVGLDNYAKLFSSDSVVFSDFWNSMKATGIFTLFSVPLLLTAPLGVALLMNRKFRGRNFFRAIYFAPYVLGVSVVAVP